MPKVLIADDHPEIRRLCSINLLARNYEVIEAADGSECLQLIQKEKPDVILLDLTMPVLSGWAVLRIFVKHVGKVVSPRMLLHQAWGPEYGDEGDYVGTYVTRLRKKLGPKPQMPQYILTERGIGYCLLSPSRVSPNWDKVAQL